MQAIGATTPAFTAALSLLLLNNRETGRTYAALLPVIIGIVIATGAEPSFNMAGFSASVIATAARALKSVLQVGTPAQMCTLGLRLNCPEHCTYTFHISRVMCLQQMFICELRCFGTGAGHSADRSQ